MEETTFQYLTSATAQVFAALAFGNFAFLVTLFDHSKRRLADLSKNTASFLQGYEAAVNPPTAAFPLDALLQAHADIINSERQGAFEALQEWIRAVRQLLQAAQGQPQTTEALDYLNEYDRRLTASFQFHHSFYSRAFIQLSVPVLAALGNIALLVNTDTLSSGQRLLWATISGLVSILAGSFVMFALRDMIKRQR